MAKPLAAILKSYSDVIAGKLPASEVNKLTLGKEPGVDYDPKMPDEREFVASHSVEKHPDRVGNGPEVYNGANVKQAVDDRHGHIPNPKSKNQYKQANEAYIEEAKDPKIGSYHKVDTEGSHGKHVVTNVADGVVYHQNVKTKEKHRTRVSEWANASSPIKEEVELDEKKDDREYDYEGEMAVTKLKTICRHAEHLIVMMKPNTNLPEWVQSKIVKAEDYISTAHDYLMSEMNEEVELAEAKCNMTEAGKMCEVHGKKACPKEGDESASDKEPRYTGKNKEGRQLITDKKTISEVLTKKTPVGKVISDFEKSDDPRFKGDSKEKRKERALAAWYKMHPEKSKKKMKEESSPADTTITFPSGNSREGFKL